MSDRAPQRPLASRGDLWRLVRARYGEAEALRQTLGREHPRTLLATARLAAALRLAGRLFASLDWHATIYEPLSELPWTPAYAALSDAGVTLTSLGRFEEAARLQSYALSGLRESADEVDPAGIEASANLALTLSALGRHDEALTLQESAVELLTARLGLERSETVDAMAQHAATLGMAGRITESRAGWRTVHDLRERQFGPTHLRTLAALSNIGHTLRAGGDLERARQVQERVVGNLASIVGERHLSALGAKEDLAITLTGMEDYSPARDLGQEVVSGRSWALGPEHPQTIAAMRTLGVTLAASGSHERGAALLRDAVRRSERVLGDAHPDTVAARDALTLPLRGSEGEKLSMPGLEKLGLTALNLAARTIAQDEFAEGDVIHPFADVAMPTPEMITRIPHLEVKADGPLRPGARFAVVVYASEEKRPDEDSTPIEIDLPRELTTVLVNVWLVTSRHFEIHGEALARLEIDRHESRSADLLFDLSVEAAPAPEDDDDEPFVMAVFSHDGRPSGRVRHVLEIETPVKVTA